jgi:hypothetical protein
MRPGPRRTVYALVLLAGGIVAGSLIVSRFHLVEIWSIQRWEFAGQQERARILSRLERVGSARSVPFLSRVLEEDARRDRRSKGELTLKTVESHAAEVLVRIYPRLQSTAQAELALRMQDIAHSGHVDAARALRQLDPLPLEMFPRLVEDLDASDPRLRFLTAGTLMDAWPRSREAIFEFAGTASAEALLSFLEHRFHEKGLERVDFRASEKKDEVAAAILREHPRPEARCVALEVSAGLDSIAQPSPIVQAYHEDSSSLVRRAALRMAGYLGDAPGSLDLPRLLMESDPDPTVRAEAILARDVWSYRLEDGCRIELWEGSGFLRPEGDLVRGQKPVRKWWRNKELEGLEAILRSERNSFLRDAASMVLADSRRGSSVGAQPDLRVHEWIVWRVPSSSDLPRGDESVIFFYSERPRVLLVQMLAPPRASLRWIAPVPPRAAPEQRLVCGALPPTGGIRGILDSRYPLATWVSAGGGSARSLLFNPAMGREWCGLRVGYGGALEVEAKPAGQDPCVESLRRVGASLLAIDGRQESFLSCEGAFEAVYPIDATWADRASGELRLLCRGPESYPRESAGDADSADAGEPDDATASQVLVVRKKGEALDGRLLGRLPAAEAACTVRMSDLDLAGDHVILAFQNALVKEGLSAAEADALVSTWREKLFDADGVRVVTIIAPWVHDAVRPLRIVPQPGELVRVGVVWNEMTPGG